MFCSWLAFSLGSVHMFFARFSFFGLTWQHIRVPHHSIVMQENQVWSLDNIICYGILGTSGASMNQIHVIMMPYHKFSFFFGCRTASLERLLVRKCEALAIVIHRFGVFFFSYWCLLSLALCWYLSICRLSIITANNKNYGNRLMIMMLASSTIRIYYVDELWLCASLLEVLWLRGL